jgi:hypothetical protein
VAVIVDLEVAQRECGCSVIDVDVNAIGRNGYGPEESVLFAGVEVVDLLGATCSHEDVQSDEGEGTPVFGVVPAHEQALHESNVGSPELASEERIAGDSGWRELADADDAVEIDRYCCLPREHGEELPPARHAFEVVGASVPETDS